MKGTYLLILQLKEDLEHLQVGRLGQFSFPAGYYLYVGSAHGSGGLAARLAYHRQRMKPHPHWHIDYLRRYAPLIETWSVSCTERLECRWVEALAHLPGLTRPIYRFGSSDNGCYSHLLYAPRKPNACMLNATLLTSLPLNTAGQDHLTLDVSIYEEEA